MQDWWEGLQPRERRILICGAVLTVIILVWSFVWSPLTRATADMRVAVAQKQRLVIDLQRTATLSDSGQPTRPQGNQPATSLLVLVERTHQTHGLKDTFTLTRPDGPDAISIRFQNAPFNAMMSWLLMLENEHHLRVENSQVTRAQQPGLVNGSLVLRR